jgi:hypothetical protein
MVSSRPEGSRASGDRSQDKAHPIAPIVDFLAPPVPVACAAQVRVAHATVIEEPLRRCPVILL